MGEDSKISWTDHTFNPWIGCTKVSPGCANCYAATQDKLRAWTAEGWGKGKPRKRTKTWDQPVKWNKQASETRPRVFCASLADWLDDEVPIEWLADLLDLIRVTPNLDWLLLTKRPENWLARTQIAYGSASLETKDWIRNWNEFKNPPANVWIGTTVEDQQRADERIPHLLSIPAKARFLSCEPLLESVDLDFRNRVCPECGCSQIVNRNYLGDGFRNCAACGQEWWKDVKYSANATGIHWVITGGESGPGFRHFNPDWARSLRDQCRAANVAFHMKQMGGLRPGTMPPIPTDLQIQEFPKP